MTEVAPEGFVLTEEELDNISKEELDDLEEVVDEYIDIVNEFEEDVDRLLGEINDSEVYRKLGKELYVSFEYQYYTDDRSED